MIIAMTPTLRQRLTHLRYRARRWIAQRLTALALRVCDDDWTPPPRLWPEYGPDSCMADAAVALLLTSDVLFILAPVKRGEEWSGPTLYVNCNDLFWWACADAEPLPALGFREADEAAFWDLYARVRRDGPHGADVWCCLRRGMRPQTPIERRWREEGRWTDELEALPVREPKDCG